MGFDGFDSPQSNYFRMPNQWIELQVGITSLAELKVILYILRHTWGFHEYEKPRHITTDEFIHGRKKKDGSRYDSGTGLSNRSVIDGLRKAVKDGFLVVETDDRDKARIKKKYRLHMK